MPRSFELPQELRPRLAKPLGRLFDQAAIDSGALAGTLKEASFVVSVGDRVTESLAAMGRVPDVQVVDGKEKREKRKPPAVPHSVSIRVSNPAGVITESAIEAVGRALKGRKPARILVSGEEDLLAVPAVLLAPLGASVYYGQPNEGVVLVVADTPAKHRSRQIMKKMGWPE